MKKLAITLALAILAIGTFAQTKPGFKRSIGSIEVDENTYQLFAYDDKEDGSRGYYLGLGELEVSSKKVLFLPETQRGIFVYLGANVNDAVDTFNSILALFDAPVGDAREYQARLGYEIPFGNFLTSTATVEKKALSKKTQLLFSFQREDETVGTRIQKSTVKTLLKFMSSYQKRHPDK